LKLRDEIGVDGYRLGGISGIYHAGAALPAADTNLVERMFRKRAYRDVLRGCFMAEQATRHRIGALSHKS